MNKALILSALLMLSGASALTNFPRTAPFNKTVELTATSQTTLSAALSSLTRSIGVNLVVQALPPANVTQSIKNVPAWQAIETLLKVHAPNLETLYDGKFLIIAPPETINNLKAKGRIFTVVESAVDEKQIAALTTVAPGVSVLPFGDKASILAGPPEQVNVAEQLLARITTPTPAPAPVTVAQVTETLTVTPLSPAETTTILKEAFPELKATNAGTRLVLTGPYSAIVDAKALVNTLIQDARQAAPPAPETPAVVTNTAPVAAVEPIITRESQRLTLRLAQDVVTRVAQASNENVKVVALDAGNFLLIGTKDDIASVTADLRATELRVMNRALITYPLKYAGADLVTVLQRTLPGTDMEFVAGTKQLLVRATGEDHAVLGSLLRQLDVRPSADVDNETLTKTVTLQFAQAAALAGVIAPKSGQTQQGQQGGASSSPQGPQQGSTTSSSQGQQEQPSQQGQDPGLQVSVDERSNSLVLRGRRTDVESAATLALTLDRELPNVTIRMNVQQVDNSDGRNLGIDWSAGAGGVTVGGGANGLSVAYSPAAVAPSLRVNLNAKDSVERAKTLLDTSLTTQSGRPGQLLSGGTLMVPKVSTDKDGNSKVDGYEEYNYGLEVRVVPRAVSDGRVELTITTIIGEAPSFGANGSISINKRQVDTVVTLRPDQSVTLGGIITTTELQQNSGVPILSKIPIIGALFGKTTSNKGNAVLLMTLTADSNMFRAAAQNAGVPAATAAVPSSTAMTPTQAAASAAAAANAANSVLKTTTAAGTNGTSNSTIVPPNK